MGILSNLLALKQTQVKENIKEISMQVLKNHSVCSLVLVQCHPYSSMLFGIYWSSTMC